jgi:phosphate transport system substrate-binding protein
MPSLRPFTSPHWRRPAVIRPSAVGAVTLLAAALSACTATVPAATSHSAAPQPVVATGAAVRLSGAGSTFDAPFFDLAFPRYQQAHPGVAVSYASVGSSTDISAFTAGQVNFGATDVPAAPTDLAGARGGAAVQVPVDLGAVTVAYNVPLLAGPLKLTGPVIARIFLGQVTRWNDPAIAALNPGAGVPDAWINVVHRSDRSGTTYIFSNYLSTVDPAWASSVGTGRSLRWPVGYAADGNPGVATAVSRVPYSIGYAERSYTTGTDLAPAAIQNRDGAYTTPTPAAIAADAAGRPAISPASFSIVNEPGPASYPICGYSWVLLSVRQPSPATGQALTALLDWLTHTGQAYAATLGFVPLPPAIQQLARTTLQHLTGPDGKPLTG